MPWENTPLHLPIDATSLPEAIGLDSLVPTYFRALFWSALASWEGWTDEIKCEVEDEGMSLFGEDQPTWYKSACSHISDMSVLSNEAS